MNRIVIHFVVFLLTGFFTASAVEAACGAAGCPLDVQNAQYTEKGQIRIDATVEYIEQDRPRIGRESAGVGEIRGHHDEVYTVSEIRKIGLDIGLTDRLSVQGVLPFIRREHQHIHHHHGSDFIESWNFSGIGDLELTARYAFRRGGDRSARVSGILGGVLPTGRDRALNAEGHEAEVGILPGKGAYGLIAGVSLQCAGVAGTLDGQQAQAPMFVSTTYQWNEDGDDNYRVGNSWNLNAGVVYPLFRRLGMIAQVNGRYARRDDRGNTREETQKTGGTFIYASPGLQLGLGESLMGYVLVQLPVYQRVNEIQLTSAYNLVAGLSYRFSVL